MSDGWRLCNTIDQHSKNTENMPTICVSSNSESFLNFTEALKRNINNKTPTLLFFKPGVNPLYSTNRKWMNFRRIFFILVSCSIMIVNSIQIFRFMQEQKKKKFALSIFVVCFLCKIFFLFFFFFFFCIKIMFFRWSSTIGLLH